MFRTKRVIRCARVCVTWLTVFLLAFDVGSAYSVLHDCSPGCCCGLAAGSISLCDTGCEAIFTPVSCAPISAAAPFYSSQNSCHDCSLTGCDGVCGELSDYCGGGGVVISECGDGGIVNYGDATESEQGGRRGRRSRHGE